MIKKLKYDEDYNFDNEVNNFVQWSLNHINLFYLVFGLLKKLNG